MGGAQAAGVAAINAQLSAAALNAIDNRRVAERLQAAARDAERAALPVEEGEFALVPDGKPQ